MRSNRIEISKDITQVLVEDNKPPSDSSFFEGGSFDSQDEDDVEENIQG